MKFDRIRIQRASNLVLVIIDPEYEHSWYDDGCWYLRTIGRDGVDDVPLPEKKKRR